MKYGSDWTGLQIYEGAPILYPAGAGPGAWTVFGHRQYPDQGVYEAVSDCSGEELRRDLLADRQRGRIPGAVSGGRGPGDCGGLRVPVCPPDL